MPVLERIAIVDDTDDLREHIVLEIGQRKLTPVPIVHRNASVADLVGEIRAKADMALCDQRLKSMTTNADGVEIVEALTSVRFPAILYSQQKKEDAPQLRHFYPRISRYITRDQLKAIDLARVYSEIEKEFDVPPKVKRVYRTLVQVEECVRGSAWVTIPSWRLNDTVEMSLSDIDEPLRRTVKSGTVLIAKVNLHAPSADDVYFEDFEPAPEPREDDGLA